MTTFSDLHKGQRPMASRAGGLTGGGAGLRAGALSPWQLLRRDRLALLCLGFLGLVGLAALLAPWVAPYDPDAIQVSQKFAGCSLAHPLGTDQLGRDVLSRLMWGGRATLGFSLLTMLLTVLVGTVLGLTAGFCRGRAGWASRADEAIMRFCDAMMSFPSEVMVLAIVGMLGPGLWNVVMASVIAKWPWYTRMIRAAVLQYAGMNYVLYAQVAGCGPLHILRRHLLPAAAGEIIVLATLDTGAVILAISALSFLGLGVQPPTAEWGAMLSGAKDIMLFHPQQMLPPGLLILLVVAAFNFLGDSLRDALDPLDRLGNDPMDRLGNVPLDRLGNDPMDRLGNDPLDRLGNVPLDRLGNVPMDRLGDVPMDRAGGPQ